MLPDPFNFPSVMDDTSTKCQFLCALEQDSSAGPPGETTRAQ